jgi:hypothetical protein
MRRQQYYPAYAPDEPSQGDRLNDAFRLIATVVALVILLPVGATAIFSTLNAASPLVDNTTAWGFHLDAMYLASNYGIWLLALLIFFIFMVPLLWIFLGKRREF